MSRPEPVARGVATEQPGDAEQAPLRVATRTRRAGRCDRLYRAIVFICCDPSPSRGALRLRAALSRAHCRRCDPNPSRGALRPRPPAQSSRRATLVATRTRRAGRCNPSRDVREALRVRGSRPEPVARGVATSPDPTCHYRVSRVATRTRRAGRCDATHAEDERGRRRDPNPSRGALRPYAAAVTVVALLLSRPEPVARGVATKYRLVVTTSGVPVATRTRRAGRCDQRNRRGRLRRERASRPEPVARGAATASPSGAGAPRWGCRNPNPSRGALRLGSHCVEAGRSYALSRPEPVAWGVATGPVRPMSFRGVGVRIARDHHHPLAIAHRDAVRRQLCLLFRGFSCASGGSLSLGNEPLADGANDSRGVFVLMMHLAAPGACPVERRPDALRPHVATRTRRAGRCDQPGQCGYRREERVATRTRRAGRCDSINRSTRPYSASSSRPEPVARGVATRQLPGRRDRRAGVATRTRRAGRCDRATG